MAGCMDFSKENWCAWPLDEYARRRIARGHSVHQRGGIWWQEVRRQFCWPLDMLAVLPGNVNGPTPTRALVGYHFVVADRTDSNSWFNPMLLDDVASYGLERMDSKRRNLVRKGLKSCQVRPLTRPDEMKRDGWQIETEFFERTRWHAPPPQDQWNERMDFSFREPVIDHKLGAFVGDRMVGYLNWCGIDRTGHLTHIATSHEGLKACANDALLYEWVNMLRESSAYDRATYAVRSFKASLDAFKDEHLFRLRALPARLVMNPILKLGLRRFKPDFMARLNGLDEAQSSEWLAAGRAKPKIAKPSEVPATSSAAETKTD